MGLGVPKSTANKVPGWVKTEVHMNEPIMIIGNLN